MLKQITKKYNGHPRFYELLDEMKRVHDIKNADYAEEGDPLSNLRECEKMGFVPYAGVAIRLTDKFSRLSKLIQTGIENNQVKDEPITDTLIDIANYALLMRILIEEYLQFKKKK